MDKNRKWYNDVKTLLESVFDPILDEIKQVDPRIVQPTARKSFNRINNNLMFHPDRPVYKDHFGLGFGYGKGLADFYVQLGVHNSLVAGGLWHPPVDKLKKLRSEIDYEGGKLTKIMNAEAFKRFTVFEDDRLKAAPKGYSISHEHIYLLQMKSMAVWKDFGRKAFLSGEFEEMIVQSYIDLVPFLDFINVAIAEEEFPLIA